VEHWRRNVVDVVVLTRAEVLREEGRVRFVRAEELEGRREVVLRV